MEEMTAASARMIAFRAILIYAVMSRNGRSTSWPLDAFRHLAGHSGDHQPYVGIMYQHTLPAHRRL